MGNRVSIRAQKQNTTKGVREMLNILSSLCKFFFGEKKEELTLEQLEKYLIAEAAPEKKFIEWRGGLDNKEKFKIDFHYGHLYNKLIELRKERVAKHEELKKGVLFSSPAWEEASVEYDTLTNKYPSSIHNMSLGAYETVYASVVSHYKGKLHMNRVEWKSLSDIISPYEFWSSIKEHYADEARQVFNWTIKDQTRIVEIFLKPYKD